MKVTILGLGLFGGGAGAARHFASLGHEVSVTDMRTGQQLAPAMKALEGLGIRYHLGSHPESLLREADLVVVNPGVKPDSPALAAARAAGVRLTTEINLVFELARAPIAAVTGSNGKSTTAAMLAAVLRAAGRNVLLGGNLGGSLLGEAERFPADGVIVMELSSFQLERLAWTKRSPRLAIITNVTPNHLDWHPDFDDYARAKEQIARFQTAGDFLVLNADCPVASKWAEWAGAKVARFSVKAKPAAPAAWVEGGSLMLDAGSGPRELMAAAGLPLPGGHNQANALGAALAAALLQAGAGAPAQACSCGRCSAFLPPRPAGPGEGFFAAARKALADFRGLPHRLELVAEKNGVRFYNDSIATTPESAIAALSSFDCPIALIAGGSDKGVSYANFGRAAAERADFVALTGPTGPKIRAAIEANARVRPTLADAASFDDACRQAFAAARPGWAVLMSPASASFNEFPNFERRGERFRELVGEL